MGAGGGAMGVRGMHGKGVRNEVRGKERENGTYKSRGKIEYINAGCFFLRKHINIHA